MTDLVKVTDEGRVRTITLNRAESMNALNHELAWGIVEAIDAAAQDDSVWVVALTGSGRSFCAGLDLKGTGADTSPSSPQTRYLDDLHWVGQFLLASRRRCEKPIVAGINGVAVGAGLALAMAADIRIMARGGRLMAGYPRVGGSPDGGLTVTLPQLIGYEQAMRFFLENRSVEADEALRLGLVGELVDDEALPARLADYCHSLTAISPFTSRLTKRGLVRATLDADIESQLRFELANIGRAFASADGREARKAFLEKRQPEFTGQ